MSFSLRTPLFTTGMGPYQLYARLIGWYPGVCSSHGFKPIEFDRQEIFVSRLVHLRLSGHLNRRPRSEGEELSRLHLAIERRTLPLTKHHDRVIKNRKGELTMMHFGRDTASEGRRSFALDAVASPASDQDGMETSGRGRGASVQLSLSCRWEHLWRASSASDTRPGAAVALGNPRPWRRTVLSRAEWSSQIRRLLESVRHLVPNFSVNQRY